MKQGRLLSTILILISTVLSSFARPSPLIQETYIQFTQMACDDSRVGYFCNGTPCFSDTDCFNGKCNMYARCEARILFDSQQHLNDITADKDNFIKNKLDKGNSTASKNETDNLSAKTPIDSKTMKEQHFQNSPFSDKK